MQVGAERVGRVHRRTVVVRRENGAIRQARPERDASRRVAAHHALDRGGRVVGARVAVRPVDRIRVEHVADEGRVRAGACRVHAHRVDVDVVVAACVGVAIARVKRDALPHVRVPLPHACVALRAVVVVAVPGVVNLKI